MPVQPCRTKKKTGAKYGKQGKCYTGPTARAKATKQGKAIKASKHRSK